mgnify:CR=1 FL=1
MVHAPCSMLGKRIEFGGNVADPIPEALLERPAEFFGNAFDTHEDFVLRAAMLF